MTELSLREPTFLILTALAAGAQHGYGIMTDVSQISGGHFGGRDRLPPASPPGLVRDLFRVTLSAMWATCTPGIGSRPAPSFLGGRRSRASGRRA
jgi:hypothetical protein